MAHAKTSKKSTAIDMTPMVDLAFLLITFFMLTVKFRPQETVQVNIPSSHADKPVPATDVLTVTIAEDGRVFFSVDNKKPKGSEKNLDAPGTRELMLRRVMERFPNLKLTEDQAKAFALQADVGVPIARLPEWLDLAPEERKLPEYALGVPVDTTGGRKEELSDWIRSARVSNPELRITVKGDGKAPVKVVKLVWDIMQKNKLNKFNLLTSAEAAAGSASE